MISQHLRVGLIGASCACRRGYAAPIEKDVLTVAPECLAEEFQATPLVGTGHEREVTRGIGLVDLAGVSIE